MGWYLAFGISFVLWTFILGILNAVFFVSATLESIEIALFIIGVTLINIYMWKDYIDEKRAEKRKEALDAEYTEE